jgi:hypothetical protein
MDDRWNEVLDRLRDLDARLERLERDRDRDRDDHRERERDGDYDEKRVIDTIVRLVSENVERIVARERARR